MEKSDFGLALQMLCDHGPCRDPLNLLAWSNKWGNMPYTFRGDRVECPTFRTQTEGSIAQTADLLPGTK